MDNLIKEHLEMLNKNGEVINMLVDAGVNYNMACIMNKWVVKKININKMLFDLQVITRSEEKALELVNKACLMHHCVVYK